MYGIFWQDVHQIHNHTQCIYTVLANFTHASFWGDIFARAGRVCVCLKLQPSCKFLVRMAGSLCLPAGSPAGSLCLPHLPPAGSLSLSAGSLCLPHLPPAGSLCLSAGSLCLPRLPPVGSLCLPAGSLCLPHLPPAGSLCLPRLPPAGSLCLPALSWHDCRWWRWWCQKKICVYDGGVIVKY